jgi:integrase/recombinase XerD
MRTHSADNERIKRAYFTYLKEARRLSEPSIDGAAAALSQFERYTKYQSFKKFHIQQAVGFKRKLAERVSAHTGERLSPRTLFTTLSVLRAFFVWLAGQPGFRSHLSHTDADYFSLSEKDSRVAKASGDKPVPTLEQIRHVLALMPSSTAIEQRNRALIAFTLLTGMRDGAIASLKLKHLDIGEGKVMQDAREVKTKFSKSFTTWFFPVGDDVRQIAISWFEVLVRELLFGPNDPLFPATRVATGDDHLFVATGLARTHWSNATPIRTIFREAFSAAGLPYFNPHAFRRTLAQLGERLCRTPEEFKAWSQNLGHETVLTTFSSYGGVASPRQAELLRQLGQARDPTTRNAHVLEQVLEVLKREGVQP